MMAKRRSRSSGGSSGGGVAVFGLLLILGFIIKFFWWLVAAAVAVGLFFEARALVRHLQERRAAAAREAEEIAYRADRQNRMAQRGDARGVCGVAGAELMRDFTLEPPAVPSDAPDGVVIAGLADTGYALEKLLAHSPSGWRWAAFASVLVQRRQATATIRGLHDSMYAGQLSCVQALLFDVAPRARTRFPAHRSLIRPCATANSFSSRNSTNSAVYSVVRSGRRFRCASVTNPSAGGPGRKTCFAAPTAPRSLPHHL